MLGPSLLLLTYSIENNSELLISASIVGCGTEVLTSYRVKDVLCSGRTIWDMIVIIVFKIQDVGI